MLKTYQKKKKKNNKECCNYCCLSIYNCMNRMKYYIDKLIRDIKELGCYKIK